MNIACVDLFCGVGGLTHGLLESGIDVRAGFDIDEGCGYAYRTNNREAEFFAEDVASVTGDRLERFFQGADFTMLAGCAPCQPFSTNTSKASAGVHHKAWPLLYQFGRLVEETRPDVVTMENVPRLALHEVFDDFVKVLETSGYRVTVMPNVYCPDFGIPQHRRRLVLLASRHGKISELRNTHTFGDYATVRTAIENLPRLEAGETDLDDPLHSASRLSTVNMQRILASKPGGTWRDWPEDLVADCHKEHSGRFYSSVYGRMAWDKPAPTITTQFNGFGNGRFGHPEQNRAISLREGAMLQTFPQDYQFLKPGEKPSFTNLGRWIGNAVPPRLGEHIGRKIEKHLQSLKPKH